MRVLGVIVDKAIDVCRLCPIAGQMEKEECGQWKDGKWGIWKSRVPDHRCLCRVEETTNEPDKSE